MDYDGEAQPQPGEKPATISSLSNLCNAAFNNLCELAPESAYHGLAHVIRNETGRFQIWAGNLGALQDPESSSSLDARLRKSKAMRLNVESGLHRVESAIHRAYLIISGQKPNRTDGSGLSPEEATGQIVQWATGRLQPAEQRKEKSIEKSTTELAELFANIHLCIANLFTLSMLIRRDRPRGRTIRQGPNSPRGDTGPDITNVKDKFPKLKQNPWLAERIGSSIMQQREHIRYRQSHRRALSQPQVAVGQDGQSLTTKATSFYEALDAIGTELPVTLDDSTGQSIRSFATSYATTAVSDIGTGRRIPELSDMRLDGVQLNYDTHVECPYCRTILKFKDRYQWKHHVYSDLQLYICTFESCSAEPFASSRAWFKHELNHRRQWSCSLCNTIYQSSKSLNDHFASKHAATVPQEQRSAMIQVGEQPLTHFGEGACLLCNKWDPKGIDAHNGKRFRSHVGKHLQELAREAIPLSIDGLEVRDSRSDGGSVSEDSQEARSSIPPDANSMRPEEETTAFKEATVAEKQQEEARALENQIQEGDTPQQPDFTEIKGHYEEAMALLKDNSVPHMKQEAENEAAERQREPKEEGHKLVEEAAKTHLELTIKTEAEVRAAAAKNEARKVAALKKAEENWRKTQIFKEAAPDGPEEWQKYSPTGLIESGENKWIEKAPIKFKDAVGRKFSFPFHLCSTWLGMEELIKQAFLQIDELGPHVQEGHYDLIGPDGEIILPSVWERVVEPGWSVTMTMWPIEKSPTVGPQIPSAMGGKHGHSMPIPLPPGRRPGGIPVGMPPIPPGWQGGPPRPARHGPAPGIDIVTTGPPKTHKKDKRNSASVLTFLAGKPSKKKSSKRSQDPELSQASRTDTTPTDAPIDGSNPTVRAEEE